ncbi:hypothetical protein KKH38_03765 [Patescibacteria group bacterium]|nr:hypothetical protein [Patescibacteria group bacterium]MBU4601020.1 hypothetical protein [Patescibacteria group bacterium]MCG2698614.1 LamG domain-containing protein [Candidatus Parcubacteria bacterium]
MILPIIILAGIFVAAGNAIAAEPIEPADFFILHFDENIGGTAYDSTDNHNDFSWLHNVWGNGRYFPERVEGKWDLGIYFNQYEEYFNFSTSAPIEFSSGLTAGAWIKTDLNSSYYASFFWAGNTFINRVLQNYFILSVKDGQAFLRLKQNNVWQAELASGMAVNDNEWHFIAASFNQGDQTITFFVDGQKQDQANFELPIPLLEEASIGSREYYFDPGANNFKGAVDDVWLKAESLTEARINQIYLSGSPYKADVVQPPSAEPEIKAYYNFDENSGLTAYDLSANGYDMIWSYNHWGGGEPEPRRVSGKFNSAVNFKKVEDLFKSSFSPSLDFPGGAVIGAWVKTAASSSPAARIFWAGNTFNYSGDPENYFALSEYSGKAMLDLQYKDGCDGTVYGPRCHYRVYSIVSNKLINDNSWHFLTAVLDSRPYHHAMKLYIDGELEAEEFFPSPALFAEGAIVGHREAYFEGQQCNFEGDIDDLFILSSVITDGEVRQIYQKNQPFIWPLEKELDPVIIAPGIMGSWENDVEWVIDPVLHTYDNLIEAMVNSGYELNETLFLFPYDWRANNVLTAGLLKDKITEVKQQTNSRKVDIVAHSMGGLVSRYYVQSNEYNNDVDQLIFLNTPHQGSPESYLTYEGAYLTGGFSKLKKFIFQIEAIKHGYLSLPKYIREQITSVEQLLPVYNYLQDKVDSQWTTRMYPVQYPRNTFLENLNVSPAIEILKQRANIANMYSHAGYAGADTTLSAIKVIPDPNIYDSKWMHGYPENLDNSIDCLIGGDGDGTAPIESLDFLQDVTIVEMADTDHREIVTQAQKEVIEILTGARPDDFHSGPWSAIKRILFIRVYSPVDFAVIAPDGMIIGKDFINGNEINQIDGAFYSGFDSEAEFATIINPMEGDYQIKLQGTDDGTYQLGIDVLEENGLAEQAENLISGIISMGEEENFVVNYEEDIAEIKIVKEMNFESLIQDLNELYRDVEINKKFVKKVLEIKFRHLSKKYDKIEERKNNLHKQILKKQIIYSLEIIKKELKFYLKKDWITQTAYDILTNDINNIINQLN